MVSGNKSYKSEAFRKSLTRPAVFKPLSLLRPWKNPWSLFAQRIYAKYRRPSGLKFKPLNLCFLHIPKGENRFSLNEVIIKKNFCISKISNYYQWFGKHFSYLNSKKNLFLTPVFDEKINKFTLPFCLRFKSDSLLKDFKQKVELRLISSRFGPDISAGSKIFVIKNMETKLVSEKIGWQNSEKEPEKRVTRTRTPGQADGILSLLFLPKEERYLPKTDIKKKINFLEKKSFYEQNFYPVKPLSLTYLMNREHSYHVMNNKAERQNIFGKTNENHPVQSVLEKNKTQAEKYSLENVSGPKSKREIEDTYSGHMHPKVLQDLADRLIGPLMKRWQTELERRGHFRV